MSYSRLSRGTSGLVYLRVKIIVPQTLLQASGSIDHQFPPFFCNKEVSIEQLTQNMQRLGNELRKSKKSKLLLSTLEADGIVVISPLLQYYLSRGYEVVKIYEAIQLTGKYAFTRLGEDIYRLRREAEANDTLKLRANTYKLAANSCYGKTVEQKRNHRTVTFEDFQRTQKKINNRYCANIEEIDDNAYEVTCVKRKILMNSPKIIGVFILGYAKLWLLQFAHMISNFLEDKDFNFMLTDTDSLMIELSSEKGDLDSLVKPNKKKEWLATKWNFFPKDTSVAKRPGLFKVEFCGTACVALSPKCYIIIDQSADGDVISQKVSHKGCSKRTNKLRFDQYKNVLFNRVEHIGENRGFKRTSDGKVYQYCQKKVALTPFYMKRLVCDDWIHTNTD